MANPVFLLSGWSTSGKDTVGQILQSNFNFQRLAFADALKELVATEFQFPVNWTHSESGKMKIPKSSNGKTVRQLLIQRGQEIRTENKDPGFFARIVANKIKLSSKPIIITDWRLNIELETLCSEIQNPIYTVRVQRTGLLQSPIQDSFTETELDNFIFDIHIQNPGTTVEELYQEVIKKLSKYLLYILNQTTPHTMYFWWLPRSIQINLIKKVVKYIESSSYEYEYEFQSPHILYNKSMRNIQECISFESIYDKEFTKIVRNTIDVVIKCLTIKSLREDLQIDSIRGISIEYGDGHRIICKNNNANSNLILVVDVYKLINKNFNNVFTLDMRVHEDIL